MLNKNQSNKRNSWKYALVLPLLGAFLFFFQVKVVAQEKEAKEMQEKSSTVTAVVIDKNATETEMKNDAKTLKDQHGITLKFSNVKRNNSGEITGIKVQYKDKEGNSGVNQFNGNEPIKPIHFYKTDTEIGFGKPNNHRMVFINKNSNNSNEYSYSVNTNSDDNEEINIEIEAPDAPELAKLAEWTEIPEVPGAPETPDNKTVKKIIIKKDASGKAKPIIIINGKKVDGDVDMSDIDPTDINTVEISKGNHAIKRYGSSGKNGVIIIAQKEISKIREEAMENAHKGIEIAKIEMEKARPGMELAKIDVEKAKAEMLQMKDEMLKAKAELEKARAELESERAKIKKE